MQIRSFRGFPHRSNNSRGEPPSQIRAPRSFRVLRRARFWPCTPHSKRLFLCIINIVSYGFGNTRGQGPRLSIRPTGSSVFVFVRDVTHVQICEKSASFFEFLGHTWNMSKPVMTFVFKVLRNRLLRYILETCPNLWWRSCSKCHAIDCFGTYLRHVQTCDDAHVQSATQSTAWVHTWNMSLVAYALQAFETSYILYITTKYLWELRDSERARPRTRNVVVCWVYYGDETSTTQLCRDYNTKPWNKDPIGSPHSTTSNSMGKKDGNRSTPSPCT